MSDADERVSTTIHTNGHLWRAEALRQLPNRGPRASIDHAAVRGVPKPGTRTVTTALYGLVRDDPRTPEEFLSLAGTRAL